MHFKIGQGNDLNYNLRRHITSESAHRFLDVARGHATGPTHYVFTARPRPGHVVVEDVDI